MRIDPDAAQLLVVHLHAALVAGSATEAPGMIEASATALAETAADLGMPMTFAGLPGIEPIAPLRRFASTGNSFACEAASPFLDPDVTGALAGRSRRTLVIVGVAVEVAVLHSALDTLAAGYRVYVPVDAIGGQSARTERAALDQIAAAGGTVTTVSSLISMFAPDFAHRPGDAVLGRLKALGEARQASRNLLRKVLS